MLLQMQCDTDGLLINSVCAHTRSPPESTGVAVLQTFALREHRAARASIISMARMTSCILVRIEVSCFWRHPHAI